MSDPLPGALAGYGWSERVAILYRSEPTGPSARPGRVTRVERGAAIVVDPTGSEEPYTHTGPVAVGDWAVLDHERLTGVMPRWSSLQRQDPDTGGAQVLAANVDLVLVTIPADRPNATRTERELTLAWESGARPVVVLTKVDLAPIDLLQELTGRLSGVEIVATSTRSGVGVAEVAALLAPDRTGVLLGPSGAGKSRLTNALLGADRQRIGPVRDDDRRGRHTTTSRHLLTVPGGGVVIDTPGLRSLGLVGADHLDRAFPDIDDLAAGCRFTDCTHDTEPDCAVGDAVTAGVLSPHRLASYRKLAREAAAERLRVDPVQRREAKRLWKQRTMDARRHDKRGRSEG